MATKIPLTLKTDEDGSAEVLIEARFAGRTYLCLLDTGAAKTTLVWDEFTSTLPAISENSSHSALGSTTNSVVSIPSFELGPITHTEINVARLSADHNHPRNLIGMDILQDWTLTLNLRAGTLFLSDKSLPEAPSLFLGDRGHPYLPVIIGGQEYDTVWDTGAGLTCVDLSVIREHPDNFEQISDSVGTDSSGESMSTPLYRLSGLSCGNLQFQPHTVVALDLARVSASASRKFLIVLGYSTMKQAVWTLAFKHRRWTVKEG